jgi:hypothetical protein
MYLAEDRILCFEIFAKADHKYTLHFVRDSIAETDVPVTVVGLLKQRRRWLNGTFFASLYSILNFQRILFESSHALLRKSMVSFLFSYYFMQLLATFFLVSGFYLAVCFTLVLVLGPSSIGTFVLQTAFNLLIFLQFLFALADKPTNLEAYYNAMYVAMGLYFLAVFSMVPYFSILRVLEGDVVMAVGFSLSLTIYFVVMFLYSQFMSIFTSFFQYLFVIPTFLVMFPIYSFCNVHDVSWGTKEVDKPLIRPAIIDAQYLREEIERKNKIAAKQSCLESKFSFFRTMMVAVWMLSNLILVSSILKFRIAISFLQLLLFLIIFFNGTRFIGSCVHLVVHTINRSRERNRTVIEQLKNQNATSYRGFKEIFLDILMCPLKVHTWFSIFSVLVASPCLSAISFLWICVSGLLFGAVSWIPRLDFIACWIMISWRYLANVEFNLFSNDGSIASFLGIDSARTRHTVRKCAPSVLEGQSINSRSYLEDSSSYLPLVHFLLVKVSFTSFSLIVCLGLFEIAIIMFLAEVLKDNCVSSSSLLCLFLNSIYSQSNLTFLVRYPGSLFFGTIVLWLFFKSVSSFDLSERKLVSNVLGHSISTLSLKRKVTFLRYSTSWSQEREELVELEH